MPQNDDQQNPPPQGNPAPNGDMDLPPEMFRSGEEVKTLNLRIPRANRNFGLQNLKIQYTEVDGEAVYEGDIILGTVKQIEASQNAVGEKGLTIDGDRFRWGQRIDDRITAVNVPYVVVPDLQLMVEQAIAHWQAHTPIRFVRRTTETDYISFERKNGCSSWIGRQGGRQIISLAGGCGLGAAIHEIGHALGLFHEHTREDRNNHVEVLMKNVQNKARHNFNQHILDATDQGPYDYNSIMHYGPKTFSKNGQDTIRTKSGQPIGQRNGISAGDIAAIRTIYPDLTW